MALLVRDQLDILYRLLASHHFSHSSMISDYEQIKRIVQSLTANEAVHDEQLSEIFPEIYHYGVQGVYAQNLAEHMETNRHRIEVWMQVIDAARLSFE